MRELPIWGLPTQFNGSRRLLYLINNISF